MMNPTVTSSFLLQFQVPVSDLSHGASEGTKTITEVKPESADRDPGATTYSVIPFESTRRGSLPFILRFQIECSDESTVNAPFGTATMTKSQTETNDQDPGQPLYNCLTRNRSLPIDTVTKTSVAREAPDEDPYRGTLRLPWK